MPELIAQGSVAPATNVYYVPPPEGPNLAAAWLSGWYETRSPWARQLFEARLAQLDPTARLNALTAMMEQANRASATDAESASSAQAYAIKAGELAEQQWEFQNKLTHEDWRTLAEVQGRLNVADVESRTQRELAGVVPVAQQFAVRQGLDVIRGQLARGDQDGALINAKALIGAVGPLIPANALAVLVQDISDTAARSGAFPDEGGIAQFTDELSRVAGVSPSHGVQYDRPRGVPAPPTITGPPPLVGDVSVSGRTSQGSSVGGSVGVAQRGPPVMTAAPGALAAGEGSYVGYPPAPAVAPSAVANLAPFVELLREQLSTGAKPYGEFGDPLPGYTKKPRTQEVLEQRRELIRRTSGIKIKGETPSGERQAGEVLASMPDYDSVRVDIKNAGKRPALPEMLTPEEASEVDALVGTGPGQIMPPERLVEDDEGDVVAVQPYEAAEPAARRDDDEEEPTTSGLGPTEEEQRKRRARANR